MADRVSYSYNDFSGEVSTSGFQIAAPVAIIDIATNIATVGVAIGNITRGLPVRTQFTRDFVINSAADKAPDAEAQREEKWLVTYEDNQASFAGGGQNFTNAGFKKVFNIEIGNADLSLRVGGTDIVYSVGGTNTVTEINAFVTAFEGLARSPYGGTVRVLRIEAVGRNT